jgi:hypothetical protein
MKVAASALEAGGPDERRDAAWFRVYQGAKELLDKTVEKGRRKRS